MKDYIILRHIVLSRSHASTGKTHHSDGEKQLPKAAMLKIGKYEDTNGFYLLHFDADGNEITDTFHDSIEDAMAQAEWEYQVKPGEWVATEKT